MRSKTVSILCVACLLPLAGYAAFTSFSRTETPAGRLPRGYDGEAYSLLARKTAGKTGASLYAAREASAEDIPSGMSRIVLEAHDVFDNGVVGYQWILDADHDAFGNLIFPGSLLYFGDYTGFEYRLPENAEANATSGTVVIDGEASICLPAGIYDWMVIRPVAEGLEFPYGEYAQADDFEFLEGETYRLVADYTDGDRGPGDYVTLVVARNVSLDGLTVPASGHELGTESIGVKVTNRGTDEMDNITVAYSINGGDAVEEKLPGSLAPGETLEYTFAGKADFSGKGTYNVEAFVEAEGDMLSSDNSASASCRNMEPVDLPYECVFSDLGIDNFESEWMVINRDGDDSTWMFNEWIDNRYGSYGVAGCTGRWNGDMIGDDWLISRPLNLSAGGNSVAFSTRSVSDDKTEKIEVCVGTSPDPASMKPVKSYEVCTVDWLEKGLTVDVDADGIYYVAFHAVSDNGYNIFIGDVRIDSGEFVGKAVAKIEKLFVPYSNCDLPSDCKVGMRVSNNGTAAMTDYTLSCTVDSRKVVSESFQTPVEVGESADIYISETVDLSETGEHMLEFRLKSADIDEIVEKEVVCFDPVTTLPVRSNFSMQENVDIWQMLSPQAWNYEAYFSDFSAQKHGLENGLMCRGISFSHPVRIQLSYAAGGWDSTALGIYLGKAGADLSAYTRVYEDPEVGNVAMQAEFAVNISEAGNYSVVIADEGASDSRSFIRLNEILISEILPNDLRINSVYAPVSPYMPASQLGHESRFEAEVENRGSEPVSGVSVSMLLDGEVVSVSDASVTVAPGEKASVAVNAPLPEKQPGEKLSISFEVAGDVADGCPADNVYALADVNVTDTSRGVENIRQLEYGTGGSGWTLAVGNMYGFSAPADLTSVTVGLCETDENNLSVTGEIALNIYTVGADRSLGRLVYTEKRVRGLGGFMVFDLPDMRLEPGEYYFEVEQLSVYNMGLAYFPDQRSICYQRIGDELFEVTESGCALCIRAEFGHDAKVYAKDAWTRNISSPEIDEALFTADENVKATVRNNGYDDADLKVSLYLDGRELSSREVSLMSYAQEDIEFEGVDLSKTGAHELECRVILEDDENTSNDSFVREIVTSEEADPYMMDFEKCNDFDAAGDRLNPRWTTIDRNNVRTTYFLRYDHPHRGEPCGFMAFNPSATVPSAIEQPLKNLMPHSGDRMGLAFVYSQFEEGAENCTEADVWMVSPRLRLGEDSSFEFYVRTRDLEGFIAELEPYRVLVSDTDDAPESFRTIGDDVRIAPVEDWESVNVDLSDYDGKDVYVAIQYIGRPDINTCLMIDDLHVKTSPTGVVTVDADRSVALRYDTAAERLTVESVSEILDLEVFSSDGVKVFGANPKASGSYGVDLTTLSPGVYVASARNGSGGAVIKFVVR